MELDLNSVDKLPGEFFVHLFLILMPGPYPHPMQMILTQSGWSGPVLCIAPTVLVTIQHSVWITLIKGTFNLKSHTFFKYPKSDYLIFKFSIARIIKFQIIYYRLFIVMLFLSHSPWFSLFFSSCFLSLSFKVNFELEINPQKIHQGKKKWVIFMKMFNSSAS